MEPLNLVLADLVDEEGRGIHPCSLLLGRPQVLVCPVLVLADEQVYLLIRFLFILRITQVWVIKYMVSLPV